MDFAVPGDHKVNLKENEKRAKYLDLARKLPPPKKTNKQKTMEHDSDCDTNCNCWAPYSHQSIFKWTGRLGNKRTRGDHPSYNIIEIGQNTKKSPEDLRRLAVTMTPVENHQLTLV